ncbi:hypothetical protein [Pseudonocardia sp. TMWB2A]|uniref:hypothetical protein n=1 Tax=Pseudonocardia sp. TMWB2A TaxID=687430 RepID=UPI00307E496F
MSDSIRDLLARSSFGCPNDTDGCRALIHEHDHDGYDGDGDPINPRCPTDTAQEGTP